MSLFLEINSFCFDHPHCRKCPYVPTGSEARAQCFSLYDTHWSHSRLLFDVGHNSGDPNVLQSLRARLHLVQMEHLRHADRLRRDLLCLQLHSECPGRFLQHPKSEHPAQKKALHSLNRDTFALLFGHVNVQLFFAWESRARNRLF